MGTPPIPGTRMTGVALIRVPRTPLLIALPSEPDCRSRQWLGLGVFSERMAGFWR